VRVGIGLVLGLVLAPAASAKYCVVMDAPAKAHVGQTVTVRVMSLATGAWVGGRLVQQRPGVALPRGMSIAVVDPGGVPRVLELEPSSRPDVQRGRLTLGRRGAWELTARSGRYSPCVATQQIRVA